MSDVKILNSKVFNSGNSECEHDWVYDKPKAMMYTTPAKSVQPRICSCCGRQEEVLIEGRHAKDEKDRFVALKNKFSNQ